jgi:hypothetical protein
MTGCNNNMEIFFRINKSINDDDSMVMVILNNTIFHFFTYSQTIKQSKINSYVDLKLHEHRYYYDEEVKELQIICKKIVEEIKKGNLDHEILSYQKKYNLDECNFTKDDLLELMLHLLHLCRTVLMTNRLLTAYCLQSDDI